MNDTEQPDQRPVPSGQSYKRPGFRDVLVTWTGRILVLNTLVFIVMVMDEGSILLPSEDLLIHYGAKSSFHLVRGEFWRLFTPMFVHIGLIHFAINSLALFYIGTHIEKMVGPKWFLFIYLVSGLAGGIGSAVFVMGISAGASGAIFGLLGAGFIFERLVYRKVKQVTGERLRRGPYTGLVVINLLIGLILTTGPVRIDNGAHIGGLLAGAILTLIMLYTHPNRLVNSRPLVAKALTLGLALVMGVGAWLGTSKDFMRIKIDRVLATSESPQTKFEYLSDGIRAFPDDSRLYFLRGELLMRDGDIDAALKDLEKALADSEYYTKVEGLASDFKKSGKLREYVAIKRLLKSYIKL